MYTLMWILFLVAALVAIGSFVFSCIHVPKVNPPVITIKRRFGEIVSCEITRKWMLVLPRIHKLEKLEAILRIVEVKPSDVSTPDDASLGISVSLHLSIDSSLQGVLLFFKAGGWEGIEKAIRGIAEQEIRQWARNPNEPPRTWQEAQSSQDDLTAKLRNKILSECGGVVADGKGLLKRFGVFLDQIAIGSIVLLDEDLKKDKELLAREVLQKRAELADTNTKLEMAELVAKKLNISRARALQIILDNELIKAGHGGVYRGDFSGVLAAVANKLAGGEKS